MGKYQYLLVPDKGHTLGLGDTPGGLFNFLKAQGIPVETFESKYPQPSPNNHYTLRGQDGLEITAGESNGGDRVIVSGSITRDSKRQVSVMAVETAILNFCIQQAGTAGAAAQARHP